MTNQTNSTDPIDAGAPTDATPTSNRTPENAQPKRTRGRTLLISGGAVLAAAVLIGGGVAVGAAVADENDDDGDTTSSSERQDDDTDAANASGQAAVTGTASADELLDILEAASAKAEGEPVGIEAERGGSWDVTFETAAGDESEVRVDSDGGAAVISTEVADQNDRAPEGSLDAATVEALVQAALRHTDGTVVGIEIDSDTVAPYDVSVLSDDRRTVDIALDADFGVVTADADDSDD